MIDISIVDPNELLAFWLCFAKWMVAMMLLPIFDEVAIPSTVKGLVSLVVSYALFPFVKSFIIQDILLVGASNFWLLTIYYVITGLLVGFLVKIILSIHLSAGAIISQQIGFGGVTFFDPTFMTQVGPFEKLLRITVVMLLIASGALLPMFKGILLSFDSMSIGNISQFKNFYDFFNLFFKKLLISSLLLASPIIFTNLLINMILGIVSRMVPQLNVMVISFVANIGLGLFVFYLISSEFFQAAYKVYINELGDWFQFII